MKSGGRVVTKRVRASLAHGGCRNNCRQHPRDGSTGDCRQSGGDHGCRPGARWTRAHSRGEEHQAGRLRAVRVSVRRRQHHRPSERADEVSGRQRSEAHLRSRERTVSPAGAPQLPVSVCGHRWTQLRRGQPISGWRSLVQRRPRKGRCARCATILRFSSTTACTCAACGCTTTPSCWCARRSTRRRR